MASGKNTDEYKTIKKSFAKLSAAISPVLSSTADQLLSTDLINNSQKQKAKNSNTDANDRASELMSLILNKIDQDSSNFYKFVDVLKEDLDSFKTVLAHMGISDDDPSKSESGASSNKAKQSASGGAKEFSDDLSPADLVAWLSQEFEAKGLSLDSSLGQKLIDDDINGEAFMDLTDKDLEDIGFKRGQRMKLLKIIQSVKEGKSTSQSATKASSRAPQAARATPGTRDVADLSSIDDSTFDQDNWNVVYMECKSLAPKWEKMSVLIGLPRDIIEDIRTNRHQNDDCWQDALSQWIKQNYTISDTFPEPSWRSLLKAVKEVDMQRYKELASKHQIDHGSM